VAVTPGWIFDPVRGASDATLFLCAQHTRHREGLGRLKAYMQPTLKGLVGAGRNVIPAATTPSRTVTVRALFSPLSQPFARCSLPAYRRRIWTALAAGFEPRQKRVLRMDGSRGTTLDVGLSQACRSRVPAGMIARLVVDFREAIGAGVNTKTAPEPGPYQRICAFGPFQPGWSRLVGANLAEPMIPRRIGMPVNKGLWSGHRFEIELKSATVESLPKPLVRLWIPRGPWRLLRRRGGGRLPKQGPFRGCAGGPRTRRASIRGLKRTVRFGKRP